MSRIIELEHGRTMVQTYAVCAKFSTLMCQSHLWLGRFKARSFPWETSPTKLRVKNLKISLSSACKWLGALFLLWTKMRWESIQCLLENIYTRTLDNYLEDSVFVSSFPLGFLLGRKCSTSLAYCGMVSGSRDQLSTAGRGLLLSKHDKTEDYFASSLGILQSLYKV